MADTQSQSLHVLVDGECPLCKREGAYIQKLDKGRGRVVIENIADAKFDPGVYGLTQDQVMGAIHGIRVGSDGRVLEVITGLEVFRQVYALVGGMGTVLGWMLVPTKWPVIRWFADAGYRWFARNRLWLTGKQNRNGERCGSGACENGRCKVK